MTVIAQNYYFSANQNAKRLHGASLTRLSWMYSPGSCTCNQYLQEFDMATNDLIVTTKDAEAALDTATQNPDSKEFTCPPDGVRGLSTETRQKIVKSISLSGTAYDLWIVQWDFEPSETGATSATFYQTVAPPDTGGYLAGQIKPANSSTAWANGGFATSIICGGLCCYVMTVGQSPFPAADGSGPFAPQQTIQLCFSNDILHDKVRVLGSNHELVDTTNSLNQQGNIFQGAWDALQEDPTQFQINSLVLTSQEMTAFSARVGLCPPGTTGDLVKLNNNRVAAAKEGYFCMNRLDMCNNKPMGPMGINEAYESIPDHPALGGNQCWLVAFNVNHWAYDTGANLASSTTNGTQACNVWPTAVGMNCTVLTGLNATNYSANLSREITTQCFVRPGSQYAAFAKLKTTPVDYTILGALQNVMDSVEMFQPSKSNKTGKFAKLTKKLFKTVSPIVRPIVGAAGAHMYDKLAPEGVKNAFAAAERVYEDVQKEHPSSGAENPTIDQLLSFAKAAKKRAKSKGKGPTSMSEAAASSSKGKKKQ
jgi:hypothetical protein